MAVYIIPIVYVMIQGTPVPNIEIVSMDFMIRKITQTHLSANEDLLIRVPRTQLYMSSRRPTSFIVLQEYYSLLPHQYKGYKIYYCSD